MIAGAYGPTRTDPDRPADPGWGPRRDYSRFTVMMKWTAIISFVLGLIIITFVL